MQFTRRRSRRKKVVGWFLFLALLVICVFVLPPAFESAAGFYKGWKRDRALRQAWEFYRANDFAKANTALQVALRTDRLNVGVWSTIADMTEAAGAREAIQQRQQVVLLAPSDVDARVALAMTAMRFGDLFTARDALAAVSENFRSSLNYRRAVALYAMLEGNGSTAEQVLASLMKTDSTEGIRLKYLSVRLSHPDPVVSTSARQELAGLVENPAAAASALRTLVADSILRKDNEAARAWAERLSKLPDATYSDKLALATLQLLVDKKPVDELLPALEQDAGTDPAKFSELMRWLLMQRRNDKAAALIDAAPRDLKDSVLLKPVRVDLAMIRGDWPAVGELLRQGALGPVPVETIRLVMEAKAANDLQSESARFATWGKAIDFTRTNIFGLQVMYRLGVAWKWGKEVEATLQAIAHGFPGQTWAHEALVRVYTVEKNGPALQKIFSLWSEQSEGVTRLKHDAILMDLLVFGPKAPASSKKTAEDLYKNEPSNPFYATTCALAYVFDNRTQDALAIVAKLSASEKTKPARAPYLAYIYAKGFKGDWVREQLALVRPPLLLNEEVALADQARVMLEQIDAEARKLNRLIKGTSSGADAQPASADTVNR
jgi:Tfp pilus assembly protein PilF